jgi:predicted site-specific integrase-resolvase
MQTSTDARWCLGWSAIKRCKYAVPSRDVHHDVTTHRKSIEAVFMGYTSTERQIGRPDLSDWGPNGAILTLVADDLRFQPDTSRSGAVLNGQRVGYTRVSTLEQNSDRQLDGVDVDRTFTDHVSGKDLHRPELAAMLAFVREGDVVLVHSMDRLARNLDDLRATVRGLTSRGVRVRFMKEQLTFTGEDTAMPRCCCQLWVPSRSSNEPSSRSASAKASLWQRTRCLPRPPQSTYHCSGRPTSCRRGRRSGEGGPGP